MPHHQNIPLCSALILIKNPNSDKPEYKQVYPKEFEIGDDKKEFESSFKFQKESSLSFISFFNTTNYYCTSLNFQENNNTYYSLIILSKYPFYDFYRFLFCTVKKAFDNGFSYESPIEKYECIKSAISTFPKENFHQLIISNNSLDSLPSVKITVHISNVGFIYKFTHNSFTFEKFRSHEFFTQDEIMSVWHSLFLNEPVLIVAKNQIQGSLAVLSATSLFSPFPFKDEMCLWLTRDDPRYGNIMKGESEILLCATHPDNLSNIKNYFKFVIELRPKIENQDSTYDKEIFNIMKRTSIVVGGLLNTYSIENDPYYNLVEGEIDEQLISDAFKKFPPDYVLPSIAEMREFEKTKSFKEWRKNLTPGEEYREIFLNSDPETLLKNRSLGDLRRIENNLELMIESYSKDAHVDAVLRHHRKVVHNILSCD